MTNYVSPFNHVNPVYAVSAVREKGDLIKDVILVFYLFVSFFYSPPSNQKPGSTCAHPSKLSDKYTHGLMFIALS